MPGPSSQPGSTRQRHDTTRGVKRKTNMLWSILGITAQHKLTSLPHGNEASAAFAGGLGNPVGSSGILSGTTTRSCGGCARQVEVSRFLRYLSRISCALRLWCRQPVQPTHRKPVPGGRTARSLSVHPRHEARHAFVPNGLHSESSARCDAVMGCRQAFSEPEFRTPLCENQLWDFSVASINDRHVRSVKPVAGYVLLFL